MYVKLYCNRTTRKIKKINCNKSRARDKFDSGVYHRIGVRPRERDSDRRVVE